MPELSRQITDDLEHILTHSTSASNLMDEVALLRIALRAYMEGQSAEDAVAWAAWQISNSLTQQRPKV